MDQSGLERTETDISIDWDKVLYIYENVITGQKEDLRVQATIRLARMSKHAPENILARAVPILVELLRCPLSNLNLLILEASAYCLKCISYQGEGRLAVIGESSAIPSILRLLPRSQFSLQEMLLKCLRNFVTFADTNRVIVVKNGGLKIVLEMLNSCPVGLRQLLLEILSALALLREVRRVIASLGGVHFLVESAKCGSMISKTRAAQAIGLLGLVKRARRVIADSGAIQVLVDLLRDGDTSTKLVAANALGVISSHTNYIRPMAQAGAIPLYAEFLELRDPIGKEIAEDVFGVLAVAEENAIMFMDHLVRILKGSNDEATAAAACVLWNLTDYKHSVPVIQNSGAIPILVEILKNGSVDVRDKVCGVVAQLSYNEADRIALAQAGVIPILIGILEDEELRDNAAEALVNFSEDPSLCDSISSVVNIPSFQIMQDRLAQSRASYSPLASPFRQMSVEHFTGNADLV